MPEDREKLAAAIEHLLEARRRMDPTNSVATYDLHDVNGKPTPYCLVRADWLDDIWRQVQYERGTGETMMPHEHLDPCDYA